MLENKVAMVTGASRGIGRSIAIAMAKAGADVAVLYNGNTKAAEKVCEEIRELGKNAQSFCCDVGDYENVAKTVTDITKQMGSLDILVNNAGITKDGLIFMLKEKEFDAVINTNLKGAFNTIKHVSKVMMKKAKRSNCKYSFSIRYDGKYRASKLRFCKSWINWFN